MHAYIHTTQSGESEWGANTSNQTRPLIEEETPIWKHISSLGTNKLMVMDPDGAWNQEWLCWRRPVGKYCSAVVRVVRVVVVSQFRVVRHKNMAMASMGLRTKNDCADAGQLQITRSDQSGG
jgi:hypothetical protein